MEGRLSCNSKNLVFELMDTWPAIMYTAHTAHTCKHQTQMLLVTCNCKQGCFHFHFYCPAIEQMYLFSLKREIT